MEFELIFVGVVCVCVCVELFLSVVSKIQEGNDILANEIRQAEYRSQRQNFPVYDVQPPLYSQPMNFPAYNVHPPFYSQPMPYMPKPVQDVRRLVYQHAVPYDPEEYHNSLPKAPSEDIEENRVKDGLSYLEHCIYTTLASEMKAREKARAAYSAYGTESYF